MFKTRGAARRVSGAAVVVVAFTLLFGSMLAVSTAPVLAGAGGSAKPEKGVTVTEKPVTVTTGPKARQVRLRSGIEALLVNRAGSGTVLLAAAVLAGSADEPPEQAGLSHFLEHLLFDGYDALDERGVTEAFERRAAYVNAFTRAETTVYFVLAPADEAARTAEMLAGMLTRSTIAPAAFEKERGVILEELARDATMPTMLRDTALNATLWAGTPFARPVGGTPETVAKVTREDVVAYWTAHYRPQNMRLLVIGDRPLDELETIAAPFATLAPAKPPVTKAVVATTPATTTPAASIAGSASAARAHEKPPAVGPLLAPGTWRTATTATDASEATLAVTIPVRAAPAPGAGAGASAPGFAATIELLADWLGDDAGPLARGLVPATCRSVSAGEEWRRRDDAIEVRCQAADGVRPETIAQALSDALAAAAAGPSDADVARLARAGKASRAIEGQRLHYAAVLYAEAFATTGEPLLHAIEPPPASADAVRAAARTLLGAGSVAPRAAWAGPAGPDGPQPWPGAAPDGTVRAVRAGGEGAVPGAAPGSTPPTAAASAPIPASFGPMGSRVATLRSGIVVAALEEPGAAVFGLHVLIADRALRENVPGMTDLAHRALGDERALLPGERLSARLSRAGLDLKTADDPNLPFDDDDTVPEYAFLKLEGPAGSLGDALGILTDLLGRRASGDAYARARAAHEQERKAFAQGGAAGARALRERLYGPGHPLARPVAGKPGDPIPTEAELSAALAVPALFDPPRLVVTGAGAVTVEEIAEAFGTLFESAPAAAPARGPYPPAVPGPAPEPAPEPASERAAAAPTAAVAGGMPPAGAMAPAMPPAGAGPPGGAPGGAPGGSSAGAPGGMPGGMPGMPGAKPSAPALNLAWGRLAQVPAGERAALLVAVNALSDRMVAVIREKEGLSYRLGAGVRGMPDDTWLIAASVGTRATNRARVAALFAELATALGRDELPAAEIERLVARVRQREMLSRLSAATRAARLGRALFEGEGSPLGVNADVQRRVTPAQVRDAAARWLAPSALLESVAK